jgi:hypothetical protein
MGMPYGLIVSNMFTLTIATDHGLFRELNEQRRRSICAPIVEKRSPMLVEKHIDDLIEAGWNVIESDFDELAFLMWKKRAFDCLKQMLGPEHTYTQYFRDYVRQAEARNLLAGKGILTAVKAELESEKRIDFPQRSAGGCDRCSHG